MSRKKNSVWDAVEKLVPILFLMIVGAVSLPAARSVLVSLAALVGFALAAVIAIGILRKAKARQGVHRNDGYRSPSGGMGNDSPYRAPLPSSAGKTEAEIKGEIGEMKLVNMLQRGLDQRTHSILKDLYLPMDDETTAQIDAVVVSEAGIFVVEMKNYKGWVFGSVGDPCWTQSLVAKGRTSKRFTFQNPIRQNYEHICVLAKCLGIEHEYFYSVVVFPDVACLKGEIADAEIRVANGIVDLKTVAAHIRDSQHPLIKPSQLPEVISAINEWQATVTLEQRKKHVDNLKRKHAKPAH